MSIELHSWTRDNCSDPDKWKCRKCKITIRMMRKPKNNDKVIVNWTKGPVFYNCAEVVALRIMDG